ncbi:HAD family hydrolase [Kutzneria sp. NPDC051319]|uniref:HAD family hydrolase n=1 Tax=Kutzneria sp. NPDC051319 TaxID=3155047 RepID=UPI003420FA58
MQKPLLVASDVDGTLLTPAEDVSPRTAAVIARVLADEVPFVLVTGRPPRWVPRVAELAGVTGYAVCANGAVLYDIAADRVIGKHELDPVALHEYARALTTAMPGCRVATERVGATAMDGADEQFLAEPGYTHPWPNPDSAAAPRGEVLGKAAIKLLARHPDMTSGQMAEAADAVLGNEVAVTYSSNNGLIEIAAAGVTKATGLAEVAERLGVAAAGVVAFGDMPNDVSMLSWAGHGVAMANAHPQAIAVADEVTGPNGEDGVALVLERWF